MTSVLVTGASGFIGRRVTAHALEAGLETICASRRRTNGGRSISIDLRGDLRELPRTDWVFHLAGAYAGADRETLQDADVRIARNLLAWGLDRGVENWVFASAAEVYGACSQPATEASPCRPVIPYGEVKLEIESRFREFAARRPGSRVVLLRIGEVYGPESTLITELVGRMRSGFCPWFGSGRVPVSFVHVEDVARAFLAALEAAPPGVSVVNVGDDAPGEWRAFLTQLAGHLEARPPVGLPLAVSRMYAAGSSALDRLRGRMPQVTQHIVTLLTTPKPLSNRMLHEHLRCDLRFPTCETGLRATLDSL